MSKPAGKPRSGGLLAGRATRAGTERYRRKFAGKREADFFRSALGSLHISSLGIGTYLGECDDATDRRYSAAIHAALTAGINLIDSAINYRCQRSERAVAAGLAKAVADGVVKRDEFVVSTKGGYIPLDGQPPTTKVEYESFLRAEYFDRGIMTPADVVAGGHCLAPGYISDQITRSSRNLGVGTIDIYYLHNPEQQLDSVPRELFLQRLRDAFAVLEQAVADGRIACYGCATWNGLRVDSSSRAHLNLDDLLSLARDAGGARHHFQVLQLPINLAMPEAIRSPTQGTANGRVPLLTAAAERGLAVVASAPLMQGQLSRDLPDGIRAAFPDLTTDAQRAVAFVRRHPAVKAALVGMKSPEHLEEQLAAVRTGK